MMAIYCDTHVHCYDFNQLERLLDHALINFIEASSGDSDGEFVLFFTDGNADKTWQRLHKFFANQANNTAELTHWELCLDAELGSIVASNSINDKKIHLFPARQLNSAERLEFLILGYAGDDEDGAPANEIIEQFANDYLVLSPWGVGKWLFGRGKILNQLIDDFGDRFFLGDNGGRPWFWRGVSHFREAQNPIFNGSDPLPIEGELGRVASFGVRIETQSDSQPRCDQILKLLKDKSVRKTNFGTALGLKRFILSRIKLAKRSMPNVSE